jgi:hypothetical protein
MGDQYAIHIQGQRKSYRGAQAGCNISVGYSMTLMVSLSMYPRNTGVVGTVNRR